MKKIFVILMAIMMVFGAVSAFAAGQGEDGGAASDVAGDVNGDGVFMVS